MFFCCVLGECRESLAEQLFSAMFPAGVVMFVLLLLFWMVWFVFLLFLSWFLLFMFFCGACVGMCCLLRVFMCCVLFFVFVTSLICFLCVFVAFWVSAVRTLPGNSLAPCFRPASLFLFVGDVGLFVCFLVVYLHRC